MLSKITPKKTPKKTGFQNKIHKRHYWVLHNNGYHLCSGCGEYKFHNLNRRLDGRVEWICLHGIGHTIQIPIEFAGNKWMYIHGCDGCCPEIKMRFEK